MSSGEIVGVRDSVGIEAFATTEAFFNKAIYSLLRRHRYRRLRSMHTFLADNDFLDDVAFLPTDDAPLTGAEALFVSFLAPFRTIDRTRSNKGAHRHD